MSLTGRQRESCLSLAARGSGIPKCLPEVNCVSYWPPVELYLLLIARRSHVSYGLRAARGVMSLTGC